MPAVVREADDRDSLLLGLVENVAREQLSPVEEARAYAAPDRRVRALARRGRRAGRPLEAVGLQPDPPPRPPRRRARHGRARRAEGGHARAVLAVPDQDGRRSLAREIVKTGMSVRAAEQKARWAGAQAEAADEERAGSRPGACEARPHGSRAAHRAAGACHARPRRDPVRRRVRARRARRGARTVRACGVTERPAGSFYRHGRTLVQDIESFERVSQDAFASRLVLRLAQLSREGRLEPFVTQVVASRRARRGHALGDRRARRGRGLPPRDGGLPRPHRGSALSCARPLRALQPWAIVDSNHGPPPYQSGALTN